MRCEASLCACSDFAHDNGLHYIGTGCFQGQCIGDGVHVHKLHLRVLPRVLHFSAVLVSEDDISDAISQLKTHKSDAFGVTTKHLKFALPVITKHLSSFLTSILRHGYMPQSFRDSVLVPVPKGNKDASIAL